MKKLIIIMLLILLIAIGYFYLINTVNETFSLANVKQYITIYADFIDKNFGWVMLGYFLVYVLAAALSLPIAALLTVTAGAIFGVLYGVVVVSFASTIGASITFLLFRFVLSDRAHRKFPDIMQKMDSYMQGNHATAVFGLRLVPLFPFFAVNVGLALTDVRLKTFYIYSQLGMLPGTIVYVNAGTQISKLQSLNDILSPTFLLSFVALGLLPFIGKIVYNKFLK